MGRLIGLTGFAGSGKDTAALILAQEHGFARVAFADPLRDMLYALNPIAHGGPMGTLRVASIVDSFGWDTAKREFPEVRRLLQRIGTEVGRATFGEDVWLDRGMSKARASQAPVVFTDVRMGNEALAIRALSGQVWRVARPGVSALDDHVSELGLPAHLVDRTILNDGSLSDLSYALLGALLDG